MEDARGLTVIILTNGTDGRVGARRTHTKWPNGNFIQSRFTSDTHFFGAEAANCKLFFVWRREPQMENSEKKRMSLECVAVIILAYLRSGRLSNTYSSAIGRFPIAMLHSHVSIARIFAIVFNLCERHVMCSMHKWIGANAMQNILQHMVCCHRCSDLKTLILRKALPHYVHCILYLL